MAVQLHNSITGSHLPQRIERKFYLIPKNIGPAYGLLRHICYLDTEYPQEQINSLYFDTADLDQHTKSLSGDFRKDKVRIRWYGKNNYLNGTETAFIELKTRQGFASTKQRLKLQVPAENTSTHRLSDGIVTKTLLRDTLAGFGYFPPEPLQPVIKISYWRYRFREVLTGQSVALDCHIRSTIISRELGNGEKELELSGGVIEIKGTTVELPLTLRRVRILDIDWSRFSKYSSCLESHLLENGIEGNVWPSGMLIETK